MDIYLYHSPAVALKKSRLERGVEYRCFFQAMYQS